MNGTGWMMNRGWIVQLIDHDAAAAALAEGLGAGADFVELFIENQKVSSVSWLDSKVKDIKSGLDFGVGIRVIFGTRAFYGYTNESDRDELIRVTRQLCDVERRAGMNAEIQSVPACVVMTNRHPARLGLDQDNRVEEKLAWMEKIDRACRSHKRIAQVDLGIHQRWQRVQIINSEGLNAADTRHYCRASATAIAADGTLQSRAFEGPGHLGGFESVAALSPEELAETITKRALTALDAEPCPAGPMPVVIDSGFGGVIFHEACGHLLETTSIEKKASVFHDKMDEMIAHPAVSAVDDGTIDSMWGSINMDDEGMETRKTRLIDQGRLCSFLVDRVGELKTGYSRTGSGRRQSYKFPPASRMRNTFIEPGQHSLEDILATVDHGLYAKAMGGGSVSPGTGDFNFAVEEAYLIEKGRVGRPLRGATLIGSGPDVLKKISMVGANFRLTPGMCGSVSGSIPVTVGQAAIKVDEILVGGQA